jgi:hypothetical protein
LKLCIDGNTSRRQLLFFQEKPNEYALTVNNNNQTFIADLPYAPELHLIAQAASIHGDVTFDRQIELLNGSNAKRNKLISAVLATVSDQDLGDDPKPWWNWWYAQNEYYQPPEKPIRTYSYENTTLVPIHLRKASCFVSGTPVWTMTGPMEIQNIHIGELVLSQNSETGELAYKPVLATTIRPEGPVLQTRLGSTIIKSTRGHPFWVSGMGWQMAKELKSGERLHTINGAVSIDEVTEAEPADCFNLVVADFNTYFVGDAKVLVHDNTLRGPTSATVPGLLER